MCWLAVLAMLVQQELERERDEPKDVFGAIRKATSSGNLGPGSSRGSPKSASPEVSDEVTQELMSKIQTLMIENEEMKLKNSVLQNTVEALSAMGSNGGGREDGNTNNNNANDDTQAN